MDDKTYDILSDSDGWTCRVEGKVVASFPSLRLALDATRASAERDRRKGIIPVIRYQDLKGIMQRLESEKQDMTRAQNIRDPNATKRPDRLVAGQRPH